MPGCAVYGCNNYSRKTKGSAIRYFTFPKNNDLQGQWIVACKRKDSFDLTYATICSVHFSEECFVTPLKHTLLQYSPKNFRNLKEDAVPSLQLPSTKTLPNSQDRHERLHKRQRVNLVRSLIVSANSSNANNSSEKCERNADVNNCNSVEVLREKLKEMEEKINKLEEMNKELCTNITQLTEENKTLKNNSDSLLEQLKNVQSTSSQKRIGEIQKILSTVFTQGQIRCLLKKNRNPRWSNEDISAAISLRSVSTKAYRYLRNKLNFPLPALSTLRRWVSTFNCSPGTLHDVLRLMKHKGLSLTQMEKITAISFDETSLCKQICFDRETETVYGPHKRVQVVMARGIFSKWKQPVYFDFDAPMSKSILLKIIYALEEIGFPVVSVTCDLGSDNRALLKDLQISTDKTFFINPFDCGRKIFVFADIPHLLKLARNHFVTKGFLLGDGSIASVFHVQQIMVNTPGDLKVAYKVSEEHIFVKNKQNVKLAAQLFSNSTAKAVQFCGEKGLLNSGWEAAAKTLQLFNDWYDVFNSSFPYNSQPGKNAYGLNLEYQNKIIDYMSSFIKSLRVCGWKSALPFQNGILISNESLKQLFSFLNTTFGVKYILTTKLNQDILESFFSFIRAMGHTNDHPDAQQFKYRLRWYIMGKHSSTTFKVNNNVQPDSETCLTGDTTAVNDADADSNSSNNEICTTAYMCSKLHDDKFAEVNEPIENEIVNTSANYFYDHQNEEQDDSDIISKEALRYLTGYVAFKLKCKYPCLGQKMSDTNEMTKREENLTWIETVSKGWLTIPSDDFWKCAQIMEERFLNFHGQNDLRRESGIIKVLTNIVSEISAAISIPTEAISYLVRTRTYIRLRHINKCVLSREEQRNRQLKKKTAKFVK